ncbi:MAG: patatin-like phospholipase family protein [Nitrospirota bacterium]
MRLIPRAGIAFALIVMSLGATEVQAAEVPRPKVCLALSGGGARGVAHVGVLKVLEELRVPVHCIAGTSMGAVVGGAYATGFTIPEMEAMLGGLSTDQLLREKPPRRDQSIRRKQEDLTNLIGPEFGFRDGGLLLPKGFVSGLQFESVLRRLARVRGASNFDELPIPFRAVATDLATGKPVVFAEGELTNAIRASMSVPGVIAPAEFDGKIFVDGMLTNNLPVSVARAMGADIVIAVNLGSPLLEPEALGSVLGVTEQMFSVLTQQNVQAALALLGPTDILIEPELGEYSPGDFDHMARTVPIGAAAARRVADRLSALSLPETEYAALRERQRAPVPPGLPAADEIRVDGLRRVNQEFAVGLMNTRALQPIDAHVLDRDILRLYGTGDFEHVGYRFVEEDGRRVLAVDANEKSWGPNYVRFGLALTSDFSGDSGYQLLVRYRRPWVNRLGAEWLTDVEVGRMDRFFTEFYQPLLVSRYLFVAPSFEWENRPLDLFSGDERIARYDVSVRQASVDLGSQFTRFGEARVGLLVGRASASLETGALAPSGSSANLGGIHTRIFMDQLNSVSFPRSGYFGQLDVLNSREALGADETYNRWDLQATVAKSFRDHTLNVGFRFGGPYGSSSTPTADAIQWGGFLKQSGFPTDALVGESISFGRLVYFKKLVRQTLLEGLYAGFSLEAGEVSNPLVPGSPEGLLKSGSVFVALDSFVGPVYLAYGRTTEGFSSYYLFLGKP